MPLSPIDIGDPLGLGKLYVVHHGLGGGTRIKRSPFPCPQTANAQQRRRHKALMRYTAASCFPGPPSAPGFPEFGEAERLRCSCRCGKGQKVRMPQENDQLREEAVVADVMAQHPDLTYEETERDLKLAGM